MVVWAFTLPAFKQLVHVFSPDLPRYLSVKNPQWVGSSVIEFGLLSQVTYL